MKDFMITSGHRHDKPYFYLSAKLFSPDAAVRQIVAALGVRQKYRHIFELKKPLPPRFFKSLFDKIVALLALMFSAPILLLLRIAYLIEGWLIPENAGPMFFYYNAVSAG